MPPFHQPCDHEGDMISSLGLFLMGSHRLAAIRAPVVASFHEGTGRVRRFTDWLFVESRRYPLDNCRRPSAACA